MEWSSFRRLRHITLKETDLLMISDFPLTDELREAITLYREFLRELPQNYPGENANDAVDAWEAYDKPEWN